MLTFFAFEQFPDPKKINIERVCEINNFMLFDWKLKYYLLRKHLIYLEFMKYVWVMVTGIWDIF